MAADFAQALLASEQAAIARADAARAKRLADLSPLALRWMALTPGWTTALAEAAGFPAGGSVQSFFDTVIDKGLGQSTVVVPDPEIDKATGRVMLRQPEALYTLNPSVAREIVSASVLESTAPTAPAPQDLATIATSILNAETAGVKLDPAVRAWAQLATLADRPWELSAFLLRKVDAALRPPAQAAPAFPEAARWIEGAAPLERLLQGNVSEAVHLAGLRYQLRQRQQDAEKYLERFLERREQLDAFKSLLESPDEEWALHYVGVGGVGKTILMRDLQTREAPSHGASVARIDFDYLAPEYPSTKPALLLLQLVEELRLHDTAGVASGYFESFSQKAVTFHEGLVGGAPARPAIDLIRDVEFQLLLDTFANAVKNLPQPVVLILDTCEELSKMLPDGTIPDNVAATFEMLQDLKRRLPKLRVVFSGRRPLGTTGAGGWTTGPAASKPIDRTYLRVHEIRGFTELEATRYLREKAKCPERLIPSILPRCPERAYTPQFQWPAASAAPPQPSARYNPYELSLYGAWAASDPNLEPKDIESANFDQYIRIRIVGRIRGEGFRRLLPALTWMGRFDRAAIRALADRDETDPEALRLIEEVAQQEWVDRQQGEFLEIERGLRPLIQDFFKVNDPGGLESARLASAAYLEALTNSKPLADLDVSHFEALVRALESEPERAAVWWQQVEDGVRRSGMYVHLLPITRRLLAEDFWPADAEPDERRITAAIAATHAAAQLHAGETHSLAGTWSLVEREADRHPIPAVGRRLKLLAHAARGIVEGITAADVDEETAAALVGFGERYFENGGIAGTAEWRLDQIVGVVSLISHSPVSPSVRAAASILCGQLLASANRPKEAQRWYQDAFAWSWHLESPTVGWLHWIPPDDLASRIRLEFLLWAYPATASPRDLDWWLEIPKPSSIDADRFGAAVLSMRAALAPASLEGLDEYREGSAERALLITPPVAALQRVPPLYVVAAEEMGRQGSVPAALDELRGHRAALESAATAYGELIDSDRASARLDGRFRLLEAGFILPDGVLTSDVPEDQYLRWMLAALTSGTLPLSLVSLGDAADRELPAETRHAVWRTMPAVEEEPRRQLLRWASVALRPKAVDGASFVDLSCRLDLAEAIEIATSIGTDALSGVASPTVDVAGWWREHQSQPLEALTLWLRAMALGQSPRLPDELVEHIGARRAATLALEEAELLALRLPARAVPLLRFSSREFLAARDPLSALLADACLCLTLARLGRHDELGKSIKNIQRTFDSIRNRGSRSKGRTSSTGNDLWSPDSWTCIENTVEGRQGEGIGVKPAWTRPWLFRIAACVAFQRDGQKGTERRARVAGAWRALLSTLPTETAGWFEPPPQKAGRKAPPAQATGEKAGSIVVPQMPVTFRATARRSRSSGSLFESGEIELSSVNPQLPIIQFVSPPPDSRYVELLRIGWGTTRLFNLDASTLLVDRESAWICWEALFASAPGAAPDMVLRRVSTLRTSSPPPTPELFGPNDFTIHTLTTDHAGADLGGSAWRIAKYWTYSSTPEALVKDMPPRKAQVLHMVGDPIETHAGVRMSFGGGEQQSAERGRLVSADEASGFFPNIQLAVIHCPMMRRSVRSGVDREKAGYLRSFAAELHARIPNVVVLPTLDFEGAAVALRCFDRVLSEPGPRPSAMVNAVREARAGLKVEGPDMGELPFDICLYMESQ